MAFPTIVDADTQSGVVTTNATAWSFAYPTNLQAGDLIFAMYAADGFPTPTFPVGFNTYQLNSGNAVVLGVACKIADGTESGSFTVTMSATEQGSWRVLRITGWHGSALPASGTGIGNKESSSLALIGSISVSATPNPPVTNPANWDVEDTLWIALMAADTSRTVSVYPSGFTDTFVQASGGSTGATLAGARLQSAVASVDPSAFTISASDEQAAYTIAIRPGIPPVTGAVTISGTSGLNLAGNNTAPITGAVTIAGTSATNLTGTIPILLTTHVLDDFNAADTTNINGRVATCGQTWTSPMPGADALYGPTTTLRIASNLGRGANDAGQFGSGILSGVASRASAPIEMHCKIMNAVFGTQLMWCISTPGTTTTTGYEALIDGSSVAVKRISGGSTQTAIGTYSGTITPNTTKVGIRHNPDGTINVLIDNGSGWSIVATYSDNTYVSGQYAYMGYSISAIDDLSGTRVPITHTGAVTIAGTSGGTKRGVRIAPFPINGGLLDDFSGGNDANIDGRISVPNGNVWQSPMPGNLFTSNFPLAITDGKLHGTNVGEFSSGIFGGIVNRITLPIEVYVTFNNYQIALCWAISTPGVGTTTGYALLVSAVNTSLYRIDNGAAIYLGNLVNSPALADGNRVGMRHGTGGAITVFVSRNGVDWESEGIQWTENTYTTGQHGILVQSNNPTLYWVDNFGGTQPPTTHAGAVTAAGSGALSATGTVTTIHSAAAAIAGTGAVTPTGTLATIHTGAVSIAGTSAVAPTGNVTRLAAVAIAGTSVVNPVGAVGNFQYGVLTAAGSGALSASAVIVHGARATLSGAAGVAPTGTLATIVTGAVSMASAASCALAGTRVAQGASVAAGTATATGTGTVTSIHSASVTIAGTGALNLIGFLPTIYSGNVTIAGTSALNLVGGFLLTGKATIAGAGALAGAGTREAQGKLTSAGVTTTTLAATVTKDHQATVTIAGTGATNLTAITITPNFCTIVGTSTVVPRGLMTYSGKVTIDGTSTVTLNGTHWVLGSIRVTGQGALALTGTRDVLAAMTSAGTSTMGGTARMIWGGRITISGTSNLIANGVSIQFDTLPSPSGGRLRFDVYDVAGNKLNFGALTTALSFKYGAQLDRIGSFTLKLPTTEERTKYVGLRYELRCYREGEGLIFRGEVARKEDVFDGDRFVTEITGHSIARALVRFNTGVGRAYNGATLATFAADLTAGTGFTVGTLSTPSTTLQARFDGYARWAAMLKGAEIFGIHLREDNINKQVDFGPFGAASGLVFGNVEQASPMLHANPSYIPIRSMSIVEESDEVWNEIIPLGGGEGVNRLTLEWSTRATPYAIQAGTGPDGQPYHFIRDTASQTAYGVSQRVIVIKEAIPLANSLAGFQNMANALYDQTATYLQRHSQPIAVYAPEVEGLRHFVNGVPTFELGDKVRLQYHGVVRDRDGTRRAYRTVDADVFLMGYDREFNEDGSDKWSFEVANIDRHEETMTEKLVETFEDMHAHNVALKNYTFRDSFSMQRESIESGNGATLYCKLDDNISLLHMAKLTVAVRAVRSNVKVVGTESSSLATSTNQSATTTTGGSSHSHTITSFATDAQGAHRHKVFNWDGSLSPVVWSADTPFQTGGPNVASTQDVSNTHQHAVWGTGGALSDANSAGHTHSLNSHTHQNTLRRLFFLDGELGVPFSYYFAVGSGTAYSTNLSAYTYQAAATHSHSISSSALSADTAHTHGYSHTHQVTIPAHNHALTYGIYQASNPTNPAINIIINGTDRTVALGGPFNTVNSEYTVDITQYLQSGATEQPLRATNTIAFTTSVLCDIEAILRLDLTRSALLPV